MRVLLSVIIIITFAFLLAFLEKTAMFEHQVAFKKSRYSVFYVLFSVLVIFLPIFILSLLRHDPQDDIWLERYTWLNFYTMVSATFIILGINTFFERTKSGSLLLGLGRTKKNKQLFQFGLTMFFLAVIDSLIFILGGSILEELYATIFYFVWSFYMIALGMSGLEFRKNGIWFMCSLIKWQQMRSYVWDLDNANVLTIQFRPRFPLSPASTSLAIPERYRDAVNQILNEHLSHRSL